MRISDWSSDVCSSDLRRFLVGLLATLGTLSLVALLAVGAAIWWWIDDFTAPEPLPERIVLAVDLHGSLDEGSPLDPLRSEEHTSELQSLMRISYAVFCLKKNKTTYNTSLQNDTTQSTRLDNPTTQSHP